MPCGVYDEVGDGSDGVAERDEQVGEEAGGVCPGVRFGDLDKLCEEAGVECDLRPTPALLSAFPAIANPLCAIANPLCGRADRPVETSDPAPAGPEEQTAPSPPQPAPDRMTRMRVSLVRAVSTEPLIVGNTSPLSGRTGSRISDGVRAPTASGP